MSKDPQPGKFRRRYEEALDNRPWTEECQGVSHDADYWYVSSNAKGKQCIVRLDSEFKVRATVTLGRLGRNHIGDIDVKSGYVYGALEGQVGVLVLPIATFDAPTKAGNGPRVFALVGDDGGAPPQGPSMPWCVYDEVTSRLYSSSSKNVNVIYAYRPDLAQQRFVHDPAHDCILESDKLQQLQGGALSANGNLILVSDRTRALHVYRLSDGHYWGQADVKRSTSKLKSEELEGVDVRLGVTHAGFETQVHVLLLDNDLTSLDDVIFKHYSVPKPANL
jgi:hypothetical protein